MAQTRKYHARFQGRTAQATPAGSGLVVHQNHERRLVSSRDADLVLLGDVEMAAAQKQADGNSLAALICGYRN